jgi:Trypsin-like peptidase domain
MSRLFALILIFSPLTVLAGNPPPEHTTFKIRVGRQECSGVIIHSDNISSLVLTCAHSFVNNPNSIWVGNYPAKMVDMNVDGDVALLSIKPNKPLKYTMIAPRHWVIKQNMSMWVAGYPGEQQLDVFQTKVLRTRIRVPNNPGYVGVECVGAPQQGQSGGGLFTDDYYLVSVCNFVDVTNGRGVFCLTESIYDLIERNSLNKVISK